MPSYYELNREKELARAKVYRHNNKAKRAATQRAWAASNPVAAKAIEKRTRAKNKDKHSQRNKEWYRKNAERIKAKNRLRYAADPKHKARVLAYSKQESVRAKVRERKRGKEYRVRFNAHRNERLSRDINFKLRARLGSRLSNAVRLGKGVKSASTMKLIGCTIDFLKAHLESQFTEGMSWNSFNRGEIHIDHIKPCATFDLQKESEQLACFHFSNLQPLWAFDNFSKHAKYELTIKVG